jgi:hypothetical protein
MDIFYVYEHWRPDTNACFYVGKGKGRRAYNFKRSHHYNNVVNKLSGLGMCVEVKMIESGLYESSAHNLEMALIAQWRGAGVKLVNQTLGGEGVSGYVFSRDIVERLAAQKRGKNLTPEHRAKISAGNLGKTLSGDTRAKISAAHTGKIQGPHSPEHRAKIAAAGIGRAHSDETKAKLSAAHLGKIISDETKAKIASNIIEKWKDEEYRARLISSHKGKKASEEARAAMCKAQAARGSTRPKEHKARISESIKAWHAARRAAKDPAE